LVWVLLLLLLPRSQVCHWLPVLPVALAEGLQLLVLLAELLQWPPQLGQPLLQLLLPPLLLLQQLQGLYR
jgi:hypothetical protein